MKKFATLAEQLTHKRGALPATAEKIDTLWVADAVAKDVYVLEDGSLILGWCGRVSNWNYISMVSFCG